ncbi:hypothetical protein SOVF_177520 [Spinacia oleracea]|uniref:Uncharacterized protein LOC110789096 n=1 Tax=Spinacia oleracea TaxID=3562 RepID=A0A9R0IHT9_SPIOL|nr:uncharacterized protein LOC110789096 [Spinacia oleracea]XP_021849438.1 uncharacterized protein LOC110789096 [Spinacia oleracea]XP_056694900.1 uncharacterized protein LOC110789096 [Spinacia oleracea]XP_056694901.1 uncharacterized protein LOC110789096 [Spinacia oleracea]KNA06819.1 hypothetical protein SOVF_177520 [Spinacia oleracea]
MEEHKFSIGQEFPDVKAFRNAIKEAAIAQHFELRVVKSDLIRYIAKCSFGDCPWRIRAVKISNSPIFTVRSLEPTHTCGCNAQNAHNQASVDWIVSFIEERLRDNINYKPKDISHDIQKQYGITIPYKQAWRARERGLAAIYGSSEEGYFLLPSFCDQIKKSNPGTVAEVYTDCADDRFQRLFVFFYASIYGFLNGCLPVIGLGGLQLKNKYLGTLLVATSFDADGGLFPLAFAVVDMENDESWIWFLSELHKALEMNTQCIPQFAFLSDGSKGIADALKTKFPSSFHAVCMRHLTDSIGKEFNDSRLVHALWQAASATTVVSFKEKMAEIEDISSEAAKWLQEFPPHSWALLYFQGIRYGHFSSNVEEFNIWITEACELPVIQVIEKIYNKLTTMFEERHSKSKSWTSVLAPFAEKRIEEAIKLTSSYQVLQSDEFEFEVISAERSDIVNIGTHCCSCRYWQLYQIPCSHAVAALLSCKKDPYALTVKYFTVESYRETYLPKLHPIPGKIELKRSGESLVNEDIQVVRPPKFRRPPGRPEKKRICTDDINREKHVVRCSRCNQTGHYKTTCKAESAERI